MRYFSVSERVQCKLLDFYEDCDEMANGIHKALMSCLEKYELDIRHISAYAADNANVNFGKHHSIYQLFNIANDHILKANCPAHIAHNTCKHACDQLSVDTETLVLKIYNHFSVSASRREELQTFFDFVDIEWREICITFAHAGFLFIQLLTDPAKLASSHCILRVTWGDLSSGTEEDF